MADRCFQILLSLQQIAIINFVIALWTEPETLTAVQACHFTSVDNSSKADVWLKIVCFIKEKVPKLNKTLKEQIFESIYEIGREISNWKTFHELYLSDPNFPSTMLTKLVWTSAGTIDYLETAKIILTKDTDVLMRYKLACLNCLEDDIRKIWKKIPTDIKIRFLSNNDPIALKKDRVLVVFWNHLNLMADKAEVEGNFEITDIWSLFDIYPSAMSTFQIYTPNRYGLIWATTTGNKVASDYFFQKSKSDEIEAFLLMAAAQILKTRVKNDRLTAALCFPKENYAQALCYFLSKMSEQQLMLVFTHHAYGVLRCFLDWPCQDLFIKNAEFLWKFLSLKHYEDLGLVLISNASKFGYNNLEAFEYFFQHSPETFALYFIFQKSSIIFDENHINVMQKILKNVSGIFIENFLICHSGFILCNRLINEEKWSVIETFARECRLSEEAKTKCRKLFVSYLCSYNTLEEMQPRIPKWRKFFNLIGITNAE